MGNLAYDFENGSTPRIVFALVDATDNETGETVAGGIVLASITVNISKNGGAFASLGVTPTEVGAGWYYVDLTASHTDTDGPIVIEASHTGTNTWRDYYTVGTATATTISDTVADAVADRILIRDVDTALTNESVTYGNAAASRTLAAAVTFLGGKIVAGTGSHAFYVKDGDGTALFTRNTDGTSSSGVFPTDVSTDTGA